MSVSDEAFRRWCKDPRADSVLSFELDYVAEEGGEPVTRTLYVSDKPYRRSDNRYRAIIQDVSDFDKGLGGDRFGVYASSYGRLLLRSPDGEHDDILDFAMDGSEWRCRLGDTAWPITDHRVMDVGTIARVASANISDIAIELQDAGLLLNKSIGGSVLIGGTGPNADKPRSFNFGLVRQVECFLVDQSANLWSHSDTGDNTIALDVQVRLESVGYTDNGDGTVTLDATPPRSGVVTATVLALPPDVDPSETGRHLTSDAMDVAVGLRSGLIADDRYAGPHATFTVGDDQDFPLGFNVTDTQKTPDFLTALCASGLCSWAFNRFNQFTYLRIRPNDLASLPVVPFDIRKDDIDENVEPDLEHELPKYYRLRGYCDKNWKLTDDVAGDVIDSDEYTQKTRVGLAVEQDDAVGETYADKPENYDKSMVLSPMLETWFSGDDDDDNDREHFKGTYLEVARANGLPWLETVKQIRVGMEFYEKELGDVARLYFDRWGFDAGELAQVIRIRKLHTARKIEFTLLRRRLSTPYPEGWERVTTGDDADTESSFVFDSVSPPSVVPPPGPPLPPGIPGPPTVVPPWTDGDGGGGPPPGPAILLAGTDNFSVIKSTDGGATWGSPVTVFAGGFGYVIGLLQLANGNILALDANGSMAKSFDGGATWNEYASPIVSGSDLPNFPRPHNALLAYDGNESIAFAAGDGGTDAAVIYSSVTLGDEGTWNAELTDAGVPGNSEGGFFGVAFNDGNYIAARFGNTLTNAFRAYTSDPTAWNTGTMASGFHPVSGCATSPGDFVIVSASGGNKVSFSIDNGGATWSTPQTITGLTDFITCIQYLDGVYLAWSSGGSGKKIWYSSDGIAYTLGYTLASGDSFMFVAALDKFYVGIFHGDSTSSIISSTDGASWSSEMALPGSDGIENYIECMIELTP